MKILLVTLSVLSLGTSLHVTENENEQVSENDNLLQRVKRQFNIGFGNQGFHGNNPQRFPQNGGFVPHNQGFNPNQGFNQPGRFPGQQFPGQQFPGASNQGQGGPQKFDVTTPQTFVRGPFGYVPANQGPNSRPGGGGGNRPPNCRGHRRRRPECQGQNGHLGLGGNQGGGGGRKPNCRGKRKNRPECNVNTTPINDQKVIDAFQNINWLARLTVDNRSVALPNLPDTPTAQASSRNFLLGVGQPDVPFQTCRTPRFEPGHCRYLQHCILQDFVFSFDRFLQYVCFIQGTFVGVCCPDSRYPQLTTPRPTTTTTTTTPRPTTPPSNRGGCGLNAKEQTRIVGGRDADPQEWPWMAALLRDGTTQYCGGVLITDRHVLTAAHCTNGFSPNSITVRLGEYNFDSTDDSGTHDYRPLSIRQHAQYNTTTFVNDIAIITLPQAAQFNDDIWPVCLPNAGPLYVDEVATVTGWGTIYYGGPVATTLQEVTIPVWTNEDCDDTYEQTIVDTVLCAGAKQGGQDSCQGDSGGPLLLRQGRSNRWAVIGVVSWGIRCAEPGFPGVYTRVNRYLDWIQQNAV